MASPAVLLRVPANPDVLRDLSLVRALVENPLSGLQGPQAAFGRQHVQGGLWVEVLALAHLSNLGPDFVLYLAIGGVAAAALVVG